MNCISQLIVKDFQNTKGKGSVIDFGFKLDNKNFNNVLRDKFDITKKMGERESIVNRLNKEDLKSISSSLSVRQNITQQSENIKDQEGTLNNSQVNSIDSNELLHIEDIEVNEDVILELISMLMTIINNDSYTLKEKHELLTKSLNEASPGEEINKEIQLVIEEINKLFENFNLDIISKDNQEVFTDKLNDVIQTLGLKVELTQKTSNQDNVLKLDKNFKEVKHEEVTKENSIKLDVDDISEKNNGNKNFEIPKEKEIPKDTDFNKEEMSDLNEQKEVNIFLNNNTRGDILSKVKEHGLPEKVSSNNVMTQIAGQIKRLDLNGQNEIKIQLMPENLGRLSLNISSIDNVVTAKIIAENFQAKEIIETNLNQLRDSLSEKGISVSNVEVFVGQDSDAYRHRQAMHQSSKTKKSQLKQLELVNMAPEESIKISNPYLDINSFDMMG